MKYLFFFQLFPTVLYAWILVLINFIKYIYLEWTSLNLLKKFLIIGTTMQFIFASRAWIEYKVNLTGISETINVSAKSNLFFVILSLISFYLAHFSKANKGNLFFRINQVLIGLLVFSCLLFPSIFLTDMLKVNDYNLHWTLFTFCFFYVMTTFLSFRRMKNIELEPKVMS